MATGVHLFVGQGPIGTLRQGEDMVAEPLVVWIIAPLCEPELDIRHTTHMADLDDLFPADEASWYTGVDPIGEPVVALDLSLDDSRGVDSCPGPEGIFTDNRVVAGEWHPGVFCDLLAVFGQAREVGIRSEEHTSELQSRGHLV